MRNICKIDDCPEFAFGHGWCQVHYMRWRRHGDPLALVKVRKLCTKADCGELSVARGLCRKHYNRWQATGQTELLGQRGERNALWKGDEGKSNAKHARVYRARGKADHCIWGCTDTFRYEWANLTGNYGDIWDFAPMCVLCHRRYDAAIRRMLKE